MTALAGHRPRLLDRLAALLHRRDTDPGPAVEHIGADETWAPLAELAEREGGLIAPAGDYQPRHAARHATPAVDETKRIGGVIAVDTTGIAVDIPAQTVTVAAESAVPAWVRQQAAGPDTYIHAAYPMELTGRLDPREVTAP